MTCFYAIEDWLFEKGYVRADPARDEYVPTKPDQSTDGWFPCAGQLILLEGNPNATIGDVLDRDFALKCGG
jgi:hypothetical protein